MDKYDKYKTFKPQSIYFETNISEYELGKELLKKTLAIEILCNLLFGNSSPLYKELYQEGIILSEFGFSYETTKGYSHLVIQGQATDIDKALKKYNEKLCEMKQNGINEADFNRIKKALYGAYIKLYDDVQTISATFLADYFKGINSFDYLEEYNLVTVEYANQILNDEVNALNTKSNELIAKKKMIETFINKINSFVNTIDEIINETSQLKIIKALVSKIIISKINDGFKFKIIYNFEN